MSNHIPILKVVRNRVNPRRVFVASLVLIVSTVVFLIVGQILHALTLYWTQTDWIGGADINSTINISNSNGWTKYYSKEYGIDQTTAGQIKLKVETSSP